MFNGSYLRACMKLQIVKKIRFCLLESGRTKTWCPGLVSGLSAKAQEPVNQWHELEGLLFSAQNTTGIVFIQGPSILLLVWRKIMFNGSFLRLCRILQFVKKIRFSVLESGWTKAWCPGLVSRPSAKAQEPLARSRGLVIQSQKLLVGAYFELSFLGVVSLFIFPIGTISLDSEPRGT